MQNGYLTQANLRTPKAAAVAGMLFSVLLIIAFWLFRISVLPTPRSLVPGFVPVRAP